MTRALPLLPLALTCVALSFVTNVNAQVDPAADFSVEWQIVEEGESRFAFSPIVTSQRRDAATLEFSLELQRASANDEIASGRQDGLITTPAGGVDTAGRITVDLTPGDAVEARLTLRHLQEGWELLDTLSRTFGKAPEPAASPQLATDPNFLEIDGLIIDRVLTKPGRDFYELFYRDWNAPFGARNFSVLIEETPFRGRQTIIRVSVDDQLLYQQILQTRYDVVEEMVGNAVAIVYGVLERRAKAEQSGGSDYVEQF